MESPAVSEIQGPVGLRFRPTEKELLGYYLYRRVSQGSSYFDPYCFVKDRDLYGETEPWVIWKEELALRGIEEEEEDELPDLYFFTELKNKSKNGSRFDRSVGSGCWKGEDGAFKLRDHRTDKVLGERKRFRYEYGAPEQEGHWIMLEYTLDPSLLKDSKPKNLVLCLLRYNKRIASGSSKKRKATREPKMKGAVPSKKRLKARKQISKSPEPQQALSTAVTVKPCSADIKAEVLPHAQVQSTVVAPANALGFAVTCPASTSKSEHYNDPAAADVPGQCTLTTDDYWSDLYLDETGTSNWGYLELDDR